MEHPEQLKDLNQVEVTGEIRDFVMEVQSDVEQEKANRGEWENRVDEWFKKRYAIRGKKVFPWPGAANFVIPVIDSHIAELKPAYVNLAYQTNPVVTYEPYGAEDVEPARKREQLMDWRLRTKVDFFKPYVIGIDTMLERGFVVFKTCWEFSTRDYTEIYDLEDQDQETLEVLFSPDMNDELLARVFAEEIGADMTLEENEEAVAKGVEQFREGKTKIEFNLVEKNKDRAKVIALDPKEDVVIPVDTRDIDDARFIDHKEWVSKNDLLIAINDGKYEEYTSEQIDAWMNKGSGRQDELQRTRRDGINDVDDGDLILIHETCVWYDVNGDGIAERCIVTWPDADPSSVLRFIELPYDHGQWPYSIVKRELIDDWVYSSRGIPALDEDFQVGISSKFNQDVDNQTIVNTPMVSVRRNSVFNMRNIRYIPGQKVEVEQQGDFAIVQGANNSQGTFLTTAQFLKAWADQRLGNSSAAVSSIANLPGGGQGGKKTAREVSEISALAGQSQSLDLLVFQNQMARVYSQIDALYEQFGPDDEAFIVNERPVRMTRREIQGKFNIVPNGRLENSNPALRAARTAVVFDRLNGDPYVRQYELRELLINDLDPKLKQKILVSEEELQQRQQQALQQQEAAKNQAIQEQLQLKNIADGMDLRKEVALEQIHGKKFAPN